MAANIKKIERIVVKDITLPGGQRTVGFDTFYENSRFSHMTAMNNTSDLILHTAAGDTKNLKIDKRIEPIDVYHEQYGIPVSDTHDCFFIPSWLKGVYCCDLDTGKIRWNYRLKHATEIFLYDDYLVCAFQDIGLRKISYEGIEMAMYPMGTWTACFRLNEPYIFFGPSRNVYYIIDTRTMSVCSKIKSRLLSPTSDPDICPPILLKVEGNCRDFMIEGYENEQPFKRRICL